MDREIRNLINKKASRPILGKGIPPREEGKDGDEHIRLTDEGLRLYKKYAGKWYYITLSSD